MHLTTAAMAALVIGFQCFAGCNASAGETDNQAPAEILWPTKSWQVSTPEEQGMDSASLARLIETVGTYRQDSLMIIRHGKIVAEAYYAPYVAGISHDLRSVTKSVVGTLTAIQLQKGSLDSVDHPVVDLFSDKEIQNADDRKKAQTRCYVLGLPLQIPRRQCNRTRLPRPCFERITCRVVLRFV